MTNIDPLDLNRNGGIPLVEYHQPAMTQVPSLFMSDASLSGAQLLPSLPNASLFGAQSLPLLPDVSVFGIPFLPSLPNLNFSLPSLDFSKDFTQTNNLGFGKDYAQEFKEKVENNRRNLPSGSLLSLGYNATKGQKLAQIAIRNTVGFTGKCATFVKRDIEQAGLGKYEYGHAYQCADILRRNPNFKEISTEGLDLKKLPKGCVLVYAQGVSRYSKLYGHIEITDGNGSARSDGKTNNIRPGARVFIPV